MADGSPQHLQILIAVQIIEICIYSGINKQFLECRHRHQATPDSEGWWELISYQEEVRNLKEIIEQLVAIPKTNDFMRDFLKEVMHVYKHDIFSLFICF